MRRLRRGAIPVLAALLTAGCAGRRPPAPPPELERPSARPTPTAVQEVGMASWYGKKFHGRTTASGERYDMHALTAAHPSLPFGTVVRVRNVDNDRTVTVRINDRGPFAKGRVIDLSYAAATRLDMIGPGVVPVEIVIVERGG